MRWYFVVTFLFLLETNMIATASEEWGPIGHYTISTQIGFFNGNVIKQKIVNVVCSTSIRHPLPTRGGIHSPFPLRKLTVPLITIKFQLADSRSYRKDDFTQCTVVRFVTENTVSERRIPSVTPPPHQSIFIYPPPHPQHTHSKVKLGTPQSEQPNPTHTVLPPTPNHRTNYVFRVRKMVGLELV